MFQDRTDAGRRLAERLLPWKEQDAIVIALPRGGVPVGYEIARLLGVPLDILIVRKLGFPGQPELAIGAIADGDQWEIVMNSDIYRDTPLPSMYVEREVVAKLNQIRAMNAILRSYRCALPLTGRTVIVVDDGIATGATMRVALQRIRRERPQKLIVATPVASEEAVEFLSKEADGIVCLTVPPLFSSVGDFYGSFPSVTEQEVVELLQLSRKSPTLVHPPT